MKNSALTPVLAVLGIVGASFACYWNASDIFFIADDFVWLERVKFLISKDPFIIFKSKGLYFAPSVYLLFWLNYITSGLDPAWFHRTDILIHTVNALLVSYLSFLLTKNKTAAFFSGLIFAVTPTNADSVVWPSSRVDTVAAIFYLSSIISYILYQRERRIRFYCLSIALFVVSLTAKSTPAILPLVILAVELVSCNKTGCKAIIFRLFPFFLISGLYLLLLSYNSTQAITQTFQIGGGLNTEGFLRGISILFFPESLIAAREALYMSLSVLLLILIIGVSLFFIPARSVLVISVMIAAIIVPLLFMSGTYVYATPSNPAYYVMGSICHRIYLGMAGFSIMIGTAIAFFIDRSKWYGRFLSPAMVVVLTAIIFVFGFIYVKERVDIWGIQGRGYKKIAERIKSYKKEMSHYSRIYLIGDSISFVQPMFLLYFNNSDLIVEIADKDIKMTDPGTTVIIFDIPVE